MKIALLLHLFCFYAVSNTIEQRIAETFNKSFENKELECFYFQPKVKALITPVEETKVSDKLISRKFILELDNEVMDITFSLLNNGSPLYRVSFNNDLVYEGLLDRSNFPALMEFGERGFFVSNLMYKSGNQALKTKYNLGKIKCNLELAKSKPIKLTGKHHINVHPHTRYDYLGLLTKPVNDYFKSMDSYVLIDAANRQGAFVSPSELLVSQKYSVPYEIFETKMSIPSEIPMVISPAGYNDYVYRDNDNVEVLFTGGNHNYCIWNNTRNLMWGLFYSKTESTLTIKYDTAATVVQRRGIIPGTSFKRKQVRGSNVLKDIFSRNPGASNNYHRAYNYYFQSDFVRRFTGLYRTLTYRYVANGFVKEEVIKGNGSRDLHISLIYL